MRLLSCIGFFCTLLISVSEGLAQQTFVSDSLYGFDPLLYNGRQYTYLLPRNAEGSPNYYQDFEQGTVAIKNKTYQGLKLNLDLYNQMLLIRYFNHEGASVIMEIPDVWLNYARIGDDLYESVTRSDGKHVYCQFVGDRVRIRTYLRKDLKLENSSTTPVFVFSKALREQYVVIDDKQYPFRNNRTFVKVFDSSIQITISNYLKNNNIKVTKAAMSEMVALADFCQKLLKP